MAITGTFLADFTSFQSAVQKAEVSLKGFEGSANKVGTALDRATDSLSGVKIVQQATIAAEAVERIGGVSKLTESELARVSATASEAAAKLRAMGQDVPPGIQKIADAAKGAHGETSSWVGTLGKMATALGLAFSVGAVINFGKSVFNAASDIKDMADTLGISTDAVQGFKFAAEQTGSSLDSVGSAINKMNVNLAGGDKATVQALKDAGLEFHAIRDMKPEDAFLTIADAIKQIPDPMLQADVAMQLFGKGAADLLPGMKEGFRELSDAADKMSSSTIKDLEAAEDAWGRLADKVTILTGTLIADMMRIPETVNRVKGSFTELAVFAANMATGDFGSAMAKAIETTKRLEEASTKFHDVQLKLPGPVKQTAEEISRLEAAKKKAAAATREYSESLNALISKWTGADLAKQVDLVSAAYDRLLARGFPTMAALANVAKAAEDLRAKGAKLHPQLTAIANAHVDVSKASPGVVDGIRDMTSAGTSLGSVLDYNATAFAKLLEIAGRPVPIALMPISERSFEIMKATPKAVTDAKNSLGELSQALANMAQVSGGSFGAVASGLSTIVGSLDAVQKAKKTFQEGWDAKDTLSGITGMASGIMGIVSAAIAAGKAVKAIWDAFDRNKGRDLVKDFAESFGGFDQLHKELQTLGAAGEELWIKLTQGVGRNNPDQAQRVIAEVEAALAKQKAAQEAATVSTEEGAQATIETATQAAKALDELNGRLQGNRDEWRAWSADVTGFLQKLAADIRAMPLPGPTGVVSGTGTISGAAATIRGPQPASATSGYAPINVNIDGEAAWSGLVRVAQQRDVA